MKNQREFKFERNDLTNTFSSNDIIFKIHKILALKLFIERCFFFDLWKQFLYLRFENIIQCSLALYIFCYIY